MKRIYLKLKKTYLEVNSKDFDTSYEQIAKVTTLSQLLEIEKRFKPDYVLCSSSLDFPEEYTENEKLIQLCNEIRNT